MENVCNASAGSPIKRDNRPQLISGTLRFKNKSLSLTEETHKVLAARYWPYRCCNTTPHYTFNTFLASLSSFPPYNQHPAYHPPHYLAIILGKLRYIIAVCFCSLCFLLCARHILCRQFSWQRSQGRWKHFFKRIRWNHNYDQQQPQFIAALHWTV